jgi:hypothetical protein
MGRLKTTFVEQSGRTILRWGEFMVFFGILLQMCIFPLPGHSYILYWAHGAVMFPFVNKMPLRLFKKIRSVLHFNDNETVPISDDALHKVRPLVNIVKVTLHTFIRVGSELELDEASVASSAFSGTVDIVDIYIDLNIDNIDPFHR